MKKVGVFFLLFMMTACLFTQSKTLEDVTTPNTTDSYTATSDLISVTTPPPAKTHTQTNTPSPTAYPNGQLNCPKSISLMYHRLVLDSIAPQNQNGETTDIESFEKVLRYLVENEYYFPTPKEFAVDVQFGVCAHKYAIIIIDDSWNDPEKMGVIKILRKYNPNNSFGGAKIWFAVVTKVMGGYTNTEGEWVDPWSNLSGILETGLVYPVSHSQTHPAELIDLQDIFGKANDKIYNQILQELAPSRQDLINQTGSDPYFFVYPGGNVTDAIAQKMISVGYIGAFTVTPGGLDKSYRYYFPRINGAMKCEEKETFFCVIDQIKTAK